jgi:hypothetical protein
MVSGMGSNLDGVIMSRKHHAAAWPQLDEAGE